LLVVKLIF